MPGFKKTVIGAHRSTLVTVAPVAISIPLTPQQSELIGRVTGQHTQTLELTANELRVILAATKFVDKSS